MIEEYESRSGYGRGLRLKKILYVVRSNKGELHHILKFNNPGREDIVDVVYAKETHINNPQEVINFYEKYFQFID